MKDYGEFHDGGFEGLWVDNETAHVFLTTFDDRRFVAVCTRVAALSATEFRQGEHYSFRSRAR